MVSKAEQRVTNWLKGINDSILYRNPFKATTCTSAGNTVSGSSKTGAIRGKCWVKKQTANAAPIQVNTNGFNQTQVGVPVMVAEHTQTGELHIIEVLWTDAVATIGENAANNASLPVVPAQYQQGVVKAANIDALRVSHPDVAPYSSGLYLRVEAGLGPYGWRVREYVSVSTSLRPATASHRWWVLAYLDTDDTVKFTTTGSVETTTPLTGMLLDGQGVSTVAAADNITIPTDALPLAVFTLENGQTTITPANTRIEDWRLHYARSGSSGSVTVTDGSTTVTGATTLDFTSGATVTQNGTTAEVAVTGGGGTGDYICIRDEKTQNTNGGAFASGSWVTRDLNTEAADTGNHASISSNQITLDAGTYRAYISVPACAVDRHQAKLYNVTDGADVLIGTSEYSGNNNTDVVTTHSLIVGRFTLAAQKVLEIRHQCQVTQASSFGRGTAANFTTEVYTVVELIRE